MSALNFDPYAALAEIENGSGLRANGANGANWAKQDQGQSLAQLAPLALSPPPKPKTHGTTVSPSWSAALIALDPCQPPDGITADRWRVLIGDALWLADSHGDAAAALGWNASDLFGLSDVPGWGGLADRLEGARHVALTDRVGHWRTDDLDGWLWRRTLRPMPTIWEVAGNG